MARRLGLGDISELGWSVKKKGLFQTVIGSLPSEVLYGHRARLWLRVLARGLF